MIRAEIIKSIVVDDKRICEGEKIVVKVKANALKRSQNNFKPIMIGELNNINFGWLCIRFRDGKTLRNPSILFEDIEEIDVCKEDV